MALRQWLVKDPEKHELMKSTWQALTAAAELLRLSTLIHAMASIDGQSSTHTWIK